MKNVMKAFALVAILSLAAFCPNSSEVQSAPASLESMVASRTTFAVIKDWAPCYDIIECGTNYRHTATYSSGTLSIPNYYEAYYYNGGSCGRIYSQAVQIPWCP